MTTLAVRIDMPSAESVSVTDDTLSVDLTDGRTISVPVEWFPRLVHATVKERIRWSQSVAVLGMRNGTSQSPFRPALGRQLVRAADAPLRGHGFGTSRLRQTPTTNGLTAYRMRLHLACVSSGTYGPFATSASRSRLRLPRTTRLALRASLAGSD